MSNIFIKLDHKDAVMPKRAKAGDLGLDVTAISMRETEDFIEYDTGLKVINKTKDIGCFIYPRSSISKYDLVLANSTGVADIGYTGNILLRFKKIIKFKKLGDKYKYYEVGDRVGQLVFQKVEMIEPTQIESFEETERGSGSFGHTGS
jgi:dUTP pyrophosphatase